MPTSDEKDLLVILECERQLCFTNIGLRGRSGTSGLGLSRLFLGFVLCSHLALLDATLPGAWSHCQAAPRKRWHAKQA